MTAQDYAEAFRRAFEGSLVADALSMPVHWYYDRDALDRDYGPVDRFHAPRNPHPDSILWRSNYEPARPDLNILHDQAKYWGRKQVHYHQFLQPGENTLNFRLAAELHRWVLERDGYDPEAWLDHYIEIMCTPGWHRDTYIEEVHRTFFLNLGRGKKPRDCAVDDLHIGALAQVPALLAALAAVSPGRPAEWEQTILHHVSLTHRHSYAATAARQLVRLLMRMAHEHISVSAAVARLEHDSFPWQSFEQWRHRPDREIIGEILTPACYLPDAMTAAVYLAWKYEDDPAAGFLANAEVGGDNCHRGAVVGSLLAMHTGAPLFQR